MKFIVMDIFGVPGKIPWNGMQLGEIEAPNIDGAVTRIQREYGDPLMLSTPIKATLYQPSFGCVWDVRDENNNVVIILVEVG